MTINSFDLYLANRIQEKKQLTIDQLAGKTERSSATIRRSIHSLNDYLAKENQFIITESMIISQLSYRALIQFIQSLTLNDFVPTIEERFDYLLSLSILQPSINLSKIYDALGISQSTKKKDRPLFVEELQKNHLTLESIRGRGITITGDELTLRLLVTHIISQTIEIDEDKQIIPRQANTPLQNILFKEMQPVWQGEKLKSLIDFLAKHRLQFNYSATKFLFAYTALAIHRIAHDQLITTVPALFVAPPNYQLFEQSEENIAFNSVLAGLDNNGQTLYQETESIAIITEELIRYIEGRILTTFYTKKTLQKEIEQYLFKCIFRNGLHFEFYDNKLDDVKKEFSFLYQLVEYFYETELSASLYLNTSQLSTITLLFREHVLKNKVAGRNQKKIVIVTNSAKEKSDFFAQQLLYHFDTIVVGNVNIHELYRLKYLKFDHLITFSNRIATILLENGYPNIKLNYYFHDEDLNYLNKLNFSNNSHRKLVADSFTERIAAIQPDALPDFLKENFPNFFV